MLKDDDVNSNDIEGVIFTAADEICWDGEMMKLLDQYLIKKE